MPLPWETDWSMEGRKESPPDKQPKQQKPWEVDWSTASPKAPRTAQKQPTIDSNAQGNTNTLESVFKKLLVAESGSKHKDEAGNLITSKVGAQGISQLMPSTAKKPGYGITPVKDDSEEEYLRVGREYLSAMYNKYQDWEKALAAYNAGTGNVDKAIGKAERYEGDWKEFLPKPKETLPYIEKILGKPKERISALNIPPEKVQKGQSAGQMVENVKQTVYDIAAVAPLTGEFISAKESYEALKRGNLAEAGLAALGAIPAIGSVGRVGTKTLYRGILAEGQKSSKGFIWTSPDKEYASKYGNKLQELSLSENSRVFDLTSLPPVAHYDDVFLKLKGMVGEEDALTLLQKVRINSDDQLDVYSIFRNDKTKGIIEKHKFDAVSFNQLSEGKSKQTVGLLDK